MLSREHMVHVVLLLNVQNALYGYMLYRFRKTSLCCERETKLTSFPRLIFEPYTAFVHVSLRPCVATPRSRDNE